MLVLLQYVIAPVEMISVFYKKDGKSQRKVGYYKEKNLLSRQMVCGTLWDKARKKFGHPAPFPFEPPRRCIKLFTFVGDTVLDSFLGSGSTLTKCVLTGRKGIGVKIHRNYCEITEKKLLIKAKVNQLKMDF
ncbi:MAG: DNA methyltransferase [Candidatus Aminicenantia bacterium]